MKKLFYILGWEFDCEFVMSGPPCHLIVITTCDSDCLSEFKLITRPHVHVCDHTTWMFMAFYVCH